MLGCEYETELRRYHAWDQMIFSEDSPYFNPPDPGRGSGPTIVVSDEQGQHLGELTLSGWVAGSGILSDEQTTSRNPIIRAYLLVGIPSLLLTLVLLPPLPSFQPYLGTLVFLGLMALLVQYFPVSVSYANLSLGVGFLLAGSLLGGPAAGALMVALVFLVWSPTRDLVPWVTVYHHSRWTEKMARSLFAAGTGALSYFLSTALALRVFHLREPVDRVDLSAFGASIILTVGVYLLQNLLSLVASMLSGDDVFSRLQTKIPVPALVEFVALPASLLLAVIRIQMGIGAFLLLAWLYLAASVLGWRSWQDRRRTRRRILDLRLLHRAGSTLSGTLEMGDVVRRLHAVLREIRDFDRLLVLVREPDKGDPQIFISDTEGQRGEADPLLIEETESRPEGLFFEADASSIFIRDLKVGDTATARIRLDFPSSNSPGRPSMVLLETICRQAAAALSNARLYLLANTDPLTGLAVRRYFERALRNVSGKEHFALIFLDLDWFKGINDTYGHAVGDVVLEDLAGVLTGSLRVMDVAARYGGEEFIILLPGASSPEAAAVAERIRRTLDRRLIELDTGQSIRYTASFGVACDGDLEEGGEAMEVVWKADEALLEAKRAGRNQVMTWAGSQS